MWKIGVVNIMLWKKRFLCGNIQPPAVVQSSHFAAKPTCIFAWAAFDQKRGLHVCAFNKSVCLHFPKHQETYEQCTSMKPINLFIVSTFFERTASYMLLIGLHVNLQIIYKSSQASDLLPANSN